MFRRFNASSFQQCASKNMTTFASATSSFSFLHQTKSFQSSSATQQQQQQQENTRTPTAATSSAPPSAAASLRKVRVKSTTRAPQTLSDLQKRISKEMNDLNKGCGASAEPVEKKSLTALQKRQLAMKDKLVFSLAPNAVYRIKLLMDGFNKQAEAKGEPKAIGIRVGVQKRGCSGLSYTINYALEPEIRTFFDRKEELEKKYNGIIPIDALDSHVEQSGVHVFVDSGSLYYVVGTKMDYNVSDVEEKFEFNNPNKKSSCGCGDSWMPEG